MDHTTRRSCQEHGLLRGLKTRQLEPALPIRTGTACLAPQASATPFRSPVQDRALRSIETAPMLQTRAGAMWATELPHGECNVREPPSARVPAVRPPLAPTAGCDSRPR